jgi:methionine-rich copper-binding protein CopC
MTRTILTIAAGLTYSVSAFAHAHLVSSIPAADSALRTAPSQVVIHYTEGVEPAFSTIQVQDAAGTDVESAKANIAPNDDKTLIAPLKPLKPGAYKVIWHATAVDTHKTEGTFTFTVGR